MAEIKLTGTIAKASTLTGQINKGVGMGELPQARGLGEFLSPAYSVNGHDLTAVSEAIQSKAGVEAPVWPDGFVKGVGRITEKLEDLETEAGKIGCLVGGEPPTEDQLLADLASANAATGKADTTLHDALNSLIEGFGGGGEEVFVVANTGKQYTKHFRHITGGIQADSSATTNFVNATELVSFETDLVGNGYCFASKVFSGCSKLESVVFSRLDRIITPLDIYYGCNALKTVQLGSIGYPITALSDVRMMRGCSAPVELTIYVDATTFGEIPGGIANYAPWSNLNAVIIYRNSTTGEVITE